jgi:hypothetical protein
VIVATRFTSSIVACGVPYRMFSATVPSKRKLSWSKTPRWRRYSTSRKLEEIAPVDPHGQPRSFLSDPRRTRRSQRKELTKNVGEDTGTQNLRSSADGP